MRARMRSRASVMAHARMRRRNARSARADRMVRSYFHDLGSDEGLVRGDGRRRASCGEWADSGPDFDDFGRVLVARNLSIVELGPTMVEANQQFAEFRPMLAEISRTGPVVVEGCPVWSKLIASCSKFAIDWAAQTAGTRNQLLWVIRATSGASSTMILASVGHFWSEFDHALCECGLSWSELDHFVRQSASSGSGRFRPSLP